MAIILFERVERLGINPPPQKIYRSRDHEEKTRRVDREPVLHTHSHPRKYAQRTGKSRRQEIKIQPVAVIR